MPGSRSFALAVACLGAAAITFAAPPQPRRSLPHIGSDAGGGFKVTAHWQVKASCKHDTHEWAILAALGNFIGDYRRAELEADIAEETNTQTGEVRAVVIGGNWKQSLTGQEYWTNAGQKVGAGGDASNGGSLPYTDVSTHSSTASVHYTANATTNDVSFSFRAFPQISPTLPVRSIGIGYHLTGVRQGFQKLEGTYTREEGIVGALNVVSCTVPSTSGKIVYREVRPDGDGRGSTEILITRTPLKTQPRTVKVEIKPVTRDWQSWVPSVPGSAEFEARIVEPPNVTGQWQIFLQKTSNLPGVCNNANITDLPSNHPGALAAEWQNQIRKDSPDLIFDFRKYGRTDRGFQPVDSPWQKLRTTQPRNAVSFSVACLDFGAYGQVGAMALVDGEYHIATFRETGENFVRIPWAPNAQEDNHMAQAAKTYLGEQKYRRRPADEDNDATPSGHSRCHGDGFSVFQEYRGFFVRDGANAFNGAPFSIDAPIEHRRLDPHIKDLFVFMTRHSAQRVARHLGDFEKASGLDVHRVGNNELTRFVDSNLIANPNREPNAPQQRGLLLIDTRIAESSVLGQTWGIGPPRSVAKVEIDGRKCADLEFSGQPSWVKNLTKMTVVHELGHGVGIEHHGDDVDYEVSATDESSGTEVKRNVALEGGQHSGDSECAIKYVSSYYYQHSLYGDDPNSGLHEYDPQHIETVGLRFCTSKQGTGLNDRSSSDWHCGDATRGECQNQIVVNDNCGRSSGGGPSHTEAGVGGDLPPQDDVERIASESRERAGVDLGFRIDRGARAGILPGESLVFRLNVSATPSSEDGASRVTQLGSSAKAWNQQVEFLVLGADGKLSPLPVKPKPVGKVSRTEWTGDSDEAPKTSADAGTQINLKPNVTFAAAFVLETAESSHLKPGKMRIFAAFPPQKAGASQILSNSLTIEIRDPSTLSSEERKRADSIRKLSQARLAYMAESFAEAETLARAVIAEMPDSLEAYLILARSLEKQGKLREAYDQYQASLALEEPRVGGRQEPPYETLAALERLRQKLGIKREPAKTQAVAAAGILALHSLSAETPAGKAATPFPVSVTKIIFEWRLAPHASTDPVGIRWIAVDTGGVISNDRVVSSEKSEPGKTSGAFILMKPSNGFVPGKYRLEVWQAGKKVHEENFEIRQP